MSYPSEDEPFPELPFIPTNEGFHLSLRDCALRQRSCTVNELAKLHMDSKFRSHVAAKLDKQQRRQRKVHTIRAVCMSVLLLTYAAGVYLAASSWQPQLQAFSPELIASRWPFKPYTGEGFDTPATIHEATSALSSSDPSEAALADTFSSLKTQLLSHADSNASQLDATGSAHALAMGESEERVVNLPLSHEINQPSTPQKSAKDLVLEHSSWIERPKQARSNWPSLLLASLFAVLFLDQRRRIRKLREQNDLVINKLGEFVAVLTGNNSPQYETQAQAPSVKTAGTEIFDVRERQGKLLHKHLEAIETLLGVEPPNKRAMRSPQETGNPDQQTLILSTQEGSLPSVEPTLPFSSASPTEAEKDDFEIVKAKHRKKAGGGSEDWEEVTPRDTSSEDGKDNLVADQ